MKILWFINIPLPESAPLFNERTLPIGGWLIGLLEALEKNPEIKIDIAFPTNKVLTVKKIKIGNHNNFGFNQKKIMHINEGETILDNIIKESNPDIIHLHGSELPYSLIVSNYAKQKKIAQILSLQGIVSNIAYHVRNTLPCSVYYFDSLRNLIKRDSIYNLEKTYKKRAKNEICLISQVKNIIGRTSWDENSVYFLSKDVKYFCCNEVLRDCFYSGKWSLDRIERYTIYFSQGDNPIKGLHILIEAIGLLKNTYPSIKIKIAGKKFTHEKLFGIMPANTKYANYIQKMIDHLNLCENINFLGILNEHEVKKELLSSHAYVMSSFIENSPNSLCEAMILGVPNITTYVGGIPSLIEPEKSSLVYQADAPYALAATIIKLFESDNLAIQMSNESARIARSRHNRVNITKKMNEVYSEVLSDS